MGAVDTGEVINQLIEEIKDAEREVTDEVKDKLVSVFREAYKKQNCISEWVDLKLVMGGGGSSIQSYTDVSRYVFSDKSKNTPQIETFPLITPNDFHIGTLPANQFHRFAVAYGLSHDWLPDQLAAHRIQPMAAPRQRIYIDPTNDG
jgi:hypothetical protein